METNHNTRTTSKTAADQKKLQESGTSAEEISFERLSREYQEQQALIDSVSSSYSSVMRLNITGNRVESMSGILPAVKDIRGMTYTDLLHTVSGTMVRQEDRDTLKKRFSRDSLLTAYQNGIKNISMEYYHHPEDENPCWLRADMTLIRRPGTGDIIAFHTVKDVNSEVILRKISSQLVQRNYESVSIYDVHSGLFRIHPVRNPQPRDEASIPFSEVIDQLIAKIHCTPDEAAELRDRYDIHRILAELDAKGSYTIYYAIRPDSASGKDPDSSCTRMKDDIFYLDENRDVIVFMLSDVTAIFEQDRENRDRMAEALQAAEQASNAKTEFLSRMSHEIRTPMNAIIGLDAIALQEPGLSSAMEDHLQKIGISARFLLSLINDILDMSRIESGRLALREETFNFEDLINGINTIMYEQCNASGIDYECVLKSFTEENYIGDKTKLQQVLINILGNAVKFTPEGGKIHFMVQQISRSKERARLRFEIADTGIGIDEAFIPHLFEPFAQENRGRTSSYGGTGLGLSISKNIVTLMGGTIRVHSIKNVGSEFTVDVDLGIPKDTFRKHFMTDSVKMRPLFTLIVDDDVIVCRHTQQILNDAGLKAEWVESGNGAVAKVTKQHKASADYDLILLDWKMPDMDGVETAREIRKIVGPDVTIIIMTTYDWADIEDMARAAGVDYFMKKPVFASSVATAFENVFRRKQNEAEPDTAPDYDFSGKRILIAEDNLINAEISKNILEMKHCTAELAENGAIAIEMFTSSPVGYYDAILMDVRMPVMDGLDATRTIRAMKKADSKTIPILAMTANAFQEDVDQSMNAGMNAHLAKPIEPSLLYETLDRFLSKKP
jgi:signal transduction histidine kinase/CheY-like chemotaxis protein